MPLMRATAFALPYMAWCTTATLGMPAHSSSTASRRLRALQEPQPPKPATATVTSLMSRSQSMGSGGTDGKVIREDVVDVVRAIRADGRSTALLTNNASELRDLWRPLIPLDELFDVVVDSSEVGMRKPAPAIFLLTLEQLGGVEPARTVFLDDAEANIVGARAVGMQAILVGVDHRPAMAQLEALLAG